MARILSEYNREDAHWSPRRVDAIGLQTLTRKGAEWQSSRPILDMTAPRADVTAQVIEVAHAVTHQLAPDELPAFDDAAPHDRHLVQSVVRGGRGWPRGA